MKRPCGYSLLEVCVAGGLLLLALSFVLEPLTTSRRGSQQIDARLQVLRVASELCDQLNARPFDEVVDESASRTLKWSGRQLALQYRIKVRQTATNVKNVDLRLEWNEDGLAHHLDFGTTVFEVLQP